MDYRKPDALFLDRDGTLIDWVHYLSDPKQVVLQTGVSAALKKAKSRGCRLFLHTNQSGVGRGYFTLAEVDAVNQEVFLQMGIDESFFDGICIAIDGPDDSKDRSYRKPSPRFELEMLEKFGLDQGECYFLGDNTSDVETALNAGIIPVGLIGAGGVGVDRAEFESRNCLIFESVAEFVDKHFVEFSVVDEIKHGIHVLDLNSSEKELRAFCVAFPYWANGVGDVLREANGKKVGFVPYGDSAWGASELLSSEYPHVSKWVVARCYDEWNEGLVESAGMEDCEVSWRSPDWSNAGRGSVDTDSKPYLLLVCDAAANTSLLQDFILDEVGRSLGMEIKALYLRSPKSISEAVTLAANAKFCVSWLADRQIEHWLFKAAVAGGVEAWASISNTRTSLRYLSDGNSNRFCLSLESSERLRSFLGALGSLKWKGSLRREDYDEAWTRDRVFIDWVLERVPSALSDAETIFAREPGSGGQYGEVSLALSLLAFRGVIKGQLNPVCVVPVLKMSAASKVELFEGLMRRHYCIEWVELFLYLSLRAPGFLQYALREAEKCTAPWGKRASLKIGCSLVVYMRLLLNGYDKSYPRLAYELLEKGAAMKNPQWDVLPLVALAAILVGDESRIDEFAVGYFSKHPGSGRFFAPLPLYLIEIGRYEKAIQYIDREVTVNGGSDWATGVTIRALCGSGKLDQALELANTMISNDLGFECIAGFPFESNQIWDASGLESSELDGRFYLEVVGKIVAPSPKVHRWECLYAALNDDSERMNSGLEKYLDTSTTRQLVLARLRIDFRLLKLDTDFLKEVEKRYQDTDRAYSLNELVLWATAVVLDGSEAELAELNKLLLRVNWVAGLSLPCDIQEISSLRDNVLVLATLLGLYGVDERRSLSERVLSSHGRSMQFLPKELSSDRLCRLAELRASVMNLLDRVIAELELRFLDV